MASGRTIAISLSVVGILAGAGAAGWHFWTEHQNAKRREAADADFDRRQALAAHDAQKPIDTTVTEVVALFRENELAARDYIDRVVRVPGVVDEVRVFRLEEGDRPTVVLKAPGGFPCIFQEDIGAKQRLAELRRGQKVTVRGVCRGTEERPPRPYLIRCVLERW